MSPPAGEAQDQMTPPGSARNIVQQSRGLSRGVPLRAGSALEIAALTALRASFEACEVKASSDAAPISAARSQVGCDHGIDFRVLSPNRCETASLLANPSVRDSMAVTIPPLVANRWLLNASDLEHRPQLLPTAPDLFSPRRAQPPDLERAVPASPDKQLGAAETTSETVSDPLGHVLDWLGASDVATSHLSASSRRLGSSPDDDFDVGQEGNTDARELFGGDIPDESMTRPQHPRFRKPKQATRHLDEVAPCPQLSSLLLHGKDESELTGSPQNDEEKEWRYRQSRTGSVGRLVVYAGDDDPRTDLLLRGGHGHPFVVTSMADGGPALMSGVKAGDRLVSINGQREVMGLTQEMLQEFLRPPVMLVFLGFVGKLHAEVRLSPPQTCQHRLCGMPLRYDVAKGSTNAPLHVYEETIFDAGLASLFLSVAETQPSNSSGSLVLTPMFELQRSEAASIVRSVLDVRQHPWATRDARSGVGAGATREDVMAVAPQKPSGDDGSLGYEGKRPAFITNMPRATPVLTPRVLLDPRMVPSRDPRVHLPSQPVAQNFARSRTWVPGRQLPGPRPSEKNRPAVDPRIGLATCSDDPCLR